MSGIVTLEEFFDFMNIFRRLNNRPALSAATDCSDDHKDDEERDASDA